MLAYSDAMLRRRSDRRADVRGRTEAAADSQPAALRRHRGLRHRYVCAGPSSLAERAAAIIAGLVFAFAPTASAISCTWSCNGRCGFRGRSGRCSARSRRRAEVRPPDRRVHRAADPVEHLLRHLSGMLLSVVGTMQFVRVAPAQRLRVAGAFAAARAWSISVAAPYIEAVSRSLGGLVGVRQSAEVRGHSATMDAYRRSSHGNYFYGPAHCGTRRAVAVSRLRARSRWARGLALTRPSAARLSYVIGLASGLRPVAGLERPHLSVSPGARRGLQRAAGAGARLDLLLMFLAALAARGCAAAAQAAARGGAGRSGCRDWCRGALEFWVAPLRLWPYPHRPPLYEFLARQPDGVVAEFPVPRLESWPAHEARYVYMSIFHWKRLVNGYSGYYPPSYAARMQRLATFPDPGSLAQLRATASATWSSTKAATSGPARPPAS